MELGQVGFCLFFVFSFVVDLVVVFLLGNKFSSDSWMSYETLPNIVFLQYCIFWVFFNFVLY